MPFSSYLTAYLSGYLSSRLEKTAQKLEEKRKIVLDLQDLEFFNREVVENLPSGLFTTDISGNVIIFNRSAEIITGVKRELIVGRKIYDVLPIFAFPFSEGRKEEVITVNGVQKIIGLGVSPLRGVSEHINGFVAIFQDLTKLKKLGGRDQTEGEMGRDRGTLIEHSA